MPERRKSRGERAAEASGGKAAWAKRLRRAPRFSERGALRQEKPACQCLGGGHRGVPICCLESRGGRLCHLPAEWRAKAATRCRNPKDRDEQAGSPRRIRRSFHEAQRRSWPTCHRPGGGRRNSLGLRLDRKSTRLHSSHVETSDAVFCLKKKKIVADIAVNFYNNVLVDDAKLESTIT